MTETPLHLRRGQTKGLTAAQRLRVVFDNSKGYCTFTGDGLIFTTVYRMMRKIGIDQWY